MCQRLNTGESNNFYFGIFIICIGPLTISILHDLYVCPNFNVTFGYREYACARKAIRLNCIVIMSWKQVKRNGVLIVKIVGLVMEPFRVPWRRRPQATDNAPPPAHAVSSQSSYTVCHNYAQSFLLLQVDPPPPPPSQ